MVMQDRRRMHYWLSVVVVVAVVAGVVVVEVVEDVGVVKWKLLMLSLSL